MGYADSGGISTWGEFSGATRAQFIDGLSYFLLRAGWFAQQKIAAFITAVAPGRSEGSQLFAGSFVYVFRSTINNALPFQVRIGATNQETWENAVRAINGGGGRGTDYSTPTPVHPLISASSVTTAGPVTTITLTFKIKGTAGNFTPTSLGAPLLGGGYLLAGMSPQAQRDNPSLPLMCWLKLVDLGVTDAFFNRFVTITMSGPVHPENVSNVRRIQVATGRLFQVVANRCQFFCFLPGSYAQDTVICGGIQYVPQAVCSGNVVTAEVNETWWLSSDSSGFGHCGTPRTQAVGRNSYFTSDEQNQDTNSVAAAAGDWLGTDAAWDSTLSRVENLFGVDWRAAVRLVAITPSNSYYIFDFSDSLIVSPMWAGEQPMLLEPLIVWGEPSDLQPRIRGQLYDSWIQSRQWPMDTITSMLAQPGHWLALTNDHKFGTLMLSVPNLVPDNLDPLKLATNWAF